MYHYCLITIVKFIYSEKATKFYEIFPLLLTVCTVVKSKGKISQNFAAFSEYMNFTENFWSKEYYHTVLKAEKKVAPELTVETKKTTKEPC